MGRPGNNYTGNQLNSLKFLFIIVGREVLSQWARASQKTALWRPLHRGVAPGVKLRFPGLQLYPLSHFGGRLLFWTGSHVAQASPEASADDFELLIFFPTLCYDYRHAPPCLVQ